METRFQAEFKDAKMKLVLRELKAGDQDFILNLYCPSSIENTLGTFTKISLEQSLELKKHLEKVLSAVEKETQFKSSRIFNSMKVFEIPLTFNEFKEKHQLDWTELKRLLFVGNTHVWKKDQTVAPLLAAGFHGGFFVKVRGNVLSVGFGKNVADIIDVMIPKVEGNDTNTERTKEFFQWENAVKCALKLTRQFSLPEYPEQEREEIEKTVNNIELLNAHSKTLLLNLLKNVCALTNAKNEITDLPERPIKQICDMLKEYNLSQKKVVYRAMK